MAKILRGRNRLDMMVCEDALCLLSRNLDGDLGRDETLGLYLHLAHCDGCRRQMERMAVHDAGIAGLRRAYEQQAIRGDLCRQIETAVRKVKTPRSAGIVFLERWMPYRAHALAALTGFLAAVLIAAIAGMPPRGDTIPGRFYFNEVILQEIGYQSWPRPVVLAPGGTIGIAFNRSFEGYCHMKMAAPDGPVCLEILHDDPDIVADPVHSLTIHRAHYASLRNPRRNDRIVFTNKGDESLTISIQQPDGKDGFKITPRGDDTKI